MPEQCSLKDVLLHCQVACDIQKHSRPPGASAWGQVPALQIGPGFRSRSAQSTPKKQTWFAYTLLDIHVGKSWKCNYSWTHSWLEIGVSEPWMAWDLVRLNTMLAVKGVLYQRNRRDTLSWVLLVLLLPLVPCTENRWSYGQETWLRNPREL